MGVNNKIPCIKCNKKLWEYIQPHLINWGYIIDYINPNWNHYSLLTINDCNIMGICGNIYCDGYDAINRYNRELVTDVEEFLERVAKLKDFTYKRNNSMEINGIEIKPGMVIVEENNNRWVVFPTKTGLGVINFDKKQQWDDINSFQINHKITKIIDLSKGESICDGDVLWDKNNKIKVNKEDIAKLFNCTIEQLEII